MYLKKALRGTIIIFVISLLGGLFGYLMRIALARSLTVEEFGAFYSVLTAFLFISYFIEAGMGQAVSRKIIEFRSKGKVKKINSLVMSILSVQVAVSLILSAIIIMSANFLAKNFFHIDTTWMIILFSVWLITLPLISLFIYIIYGYQQPEIFSLLDMLKYFLLFLFTIIGLFIGAGLKSPVIAYLVTSVFLIIIGYFFARKWHRIRFHFKFDTKLVHEIVKFGLLVLISTMAWFIITQVDTITITYFTTPSQVALYQTAVPLSAIILYITTAISLILYPIAAELSSKKDYKKLLGGLEIIYKYLLMVVIPIAIFMFAFPDIIINLLFTSKYLGAIPVLKILSISSVFFSICIINNSILTAIGKPQKVAKIMGAIALLNLIMNITLVPIIGITGAAYSTMVSFILGAIFSIVQIRKYIEFKFPYRSWTLMIIISFIIIFLTKYLKILEMPIITKIIVLASTISIIYVFLLMIFRVLKYSELKFLWDTLLKKK